MRNVASSLLVLVLTGCASAVGMDGGTASEAGTDVVQSDVVQSEVATNTCAPGTCRHRFAPSGPCLPPGGPIAGPDGGLDGCCACGADGFCSAECMCAAPDTPIATPSGDRSIAEIAPGDLVYSMEHGQRVAVRVLRVQRIPVFQHRVLQVTLGARRVLHISAGHPTADGRLFGALRVGDSLGDAQVTAVQVVPYPLEYTHDILPDSESGTYFSAGALLGSSMHFLGSPVASE